MENVQAGVISTLMVSALAWAWNQGRILWQRWQTRPSTQQRAQTELEAARRLASDNRRLVVLFGGMMIILYQLAAIMGTLFLIMYSVEIGFRLYSLIGLGALLGITLLCNSIMRYVDRIQTVIDEEQPPEQESEEAPVSPPA